MVAGFARVHERLTHRNALSEYRNGIHSEHYGSPSFSERLIGKIAFAGVQVIEGLESVTWLDFRLTPQAETRASFNDEVAERMGLKSSDRQTTAEEGN